LNIPGNSTGGIMIGPRNEIFVSNLEFIDVFSLTKSYSNVETIKVSDYTLNNSDISGNTYINVDTFNGSVPLLEAPVSTDHTMIITINGERYKLNLQKMV
jgi:hypothetical protein